MEGLNRVVEIIIICEGPTEERFVKNVLAVPFGYDGIFLHARVIRTSRHGRGGALSRDRVLRYLRDTLRERIDTYVTTFFDLYGLRSGFPGSESTGSLVDPIERAIAIEDGFHRVAVDEIQFRSDRFFPHIQPYEFESLLFSDITRFSEVESRWIANQDRLMEVRRSVPSPEYINDGSNTHPSAELKKLRGYRKVLHGTRVSQKIGLNRIRSECQHFNQWLTHIKNLPPLLKRDH